MAFAGLSFVSSTYCFRIITSRPPTERDFDRQRLGRSRFRTWPSVVCFGLLLSPDCSGLVSQILDFVGFVGPAIVFDHFEIYFVSFVGPANVFELSTTFPKTCFDHFQYPGQRKWDFRKSKLQKLGVFENRCFLLALPSILHTTKLVDVQNHWPCH